MRNEPAVGAAETGSAVLLPLEAAHCGAVVFQIPAEKEHQGAGDQHTGGHPVEQGGPEGGVLPVQKTGMAGKLDQKTAMLTA